MGARTSRRKKGRRREERSRGAKVGSDPVCVLRKENYKIDLSVGCRPSVMFPIRGVLDTGAGAEIIHERLLPPNWRENAAKRLTRRVTDASRNAMALSVVVFLHVQIGDMTTRAYLLVASNLAVNTILGTEFIDRHVKGILPKERRVIFRHGETINLLGSARRPDGDRNATQRLPSKTTPNKVRVAKQVVLSPMSKVPVLVTTRGPRPSVPSNPSENGHQEL